MKTSIVRHLLLAIMLGSLPLASARAQLAQPLVYPDGSASRKGNYAEFAVFSDDGTKLAIPGSNHTFEIWDVPSRTLLQTISRDPDFYYDRENLQFIQNGTALALLHEIPKYKGTDVVTVWDLEADKVQSEWPTRQFGWMATSPQGELLFLKNKNSNKAKEVTLTLRKATDRSIVFQLSVPYESFRNGVYSSDGLRLAFSSKRKTVICDALTGQVKNTIPHGDRSEYFETPLLSPDGKLLAILFEKSLMLWSTETGKQIVMDEEDRSYFGKKAFSENGDSLILDEGYRLRSWNTKTGVERPPIPYQGESLAISKNAKWMALLRYPDNHHALRLVMPVPHAIEPLWATQLGTESDNEPYWESFPGSSPIDHYQLAVPIQRFAFSPAGATVATTSGREIVIRDCFTGAILRRLPKHPKKIFHLTYSADGTMLASACQDGGTRIWDSKSGKILANLMDDENRKTPPHFLQFSPDGNNLAARGMQTVLWDLKRESKVGNYETYSYYPIGTSPVETAFSPDGRQLILSSDRLMMIDVESGKKQTEYHSYSLGTGPNFAVSHVGNRIAFPVSAFIQAPGETSPSRISKLRLIHHGTARDTPHPKNVEFWRPHFSADGRFLVQVEREKVSSDRDAPRLENSIIFWDVASEDTIRKLKVCPESLHGFSFSPNGKFLATIGDDFFIKIWDLQTFQDISEHRIRHEDADNIRFSPDSRMLASFGYDNVAVWDVSPFTTPQAKKQSGVDAKPASVDYDRRRDRRMLRRIFRRKR